MTHSAEERDKSRNITVITVDPSTTVWVKPGMLTRPKKNFEAEAEATMYEAEAEAGHVRVHQD